MAVQAAWHPAVSELDSAARGKLIVALDVDTVDQARDLVFRLGDSVVFYKIGLGLQLAGIDELIRELKRDRKRIFLDYKYLDIENTVKAAVKRAASVGIDFLTVHGPAAKIMRAAVAGKGDSDIKIFCVTVLTSYDAEDLQEMGYTCSVEELVIHRAKKAFEAGCDGVIASAREAEQIKRETNHALMVVTPGIRSAGVSTDDQKRFSTPFDAIRAGADYLVVGRQIINSADPVAEAEKIIGEISEALRA